MHKADHDAGLVLHKLQDRFYLPNMPLPAMHAAHGVLVGFEVEAPWSAYFPSLWTKYFLDGRRAYKDMAQSEQEALSAECSALEAALLPRLEATVECGIRRGKDRYWEFVLPPASDLSLAGRMLEALSAAMLLPRGTFSLHATVSGMPSRSDALLMLMLLELLFGRKERVKQGHKGLGAWARKGDGGVVTKDEGLLYGAELAHELRSLELPPERKMRAALLCAIAKATHCFGEKEESAAIRKKAKELLLAHGLPFKSWGSPRSSPEIWQTYLRNYDSLKIGARDIALSFSII